MNANPAAFWRKYRTHANFPFAERLAETICRIPDLTTCRFQPHHMKRLTPCLRFLFALLLSGSWPLLNARADDSIPSNVGRGLHQLVEWDKTQPAVRTDAQRKAGLAEHLGRNRSRVETDAAGRVAVDIRLDGTRPAAEVKKNLEALGVVLTAEHVARRADGRDGILSGRLSLDKATAAARIPGVFSVLAAHRPRTHVGAVTSQGVATLHADEVQATDTSGGVPIDGTGITIGVLSDSYDVATEASVDIAFGSSGNVVTKRAIDDVKSGDLPGIYNVNYPTPVVVLQDGSTDPNQGNTDEGRAMLQIAHDVAPGAKLAFCTSGETQTEFAANIESLRTNSSVNADIIADDISFDDEPFFSDGIVAQAVDEVVTSTTLAGRPVIYYSAAGNDSDLSYSADFTPITYQQALADGKLGNLKFGNVSADLYSGGLQNFKAAATGSGTKVVQRVTIQGDDAELNFQWDDPFVPGLITTDYNILVFDVDGNYCDGNFVPAGVPSNDPPSSSTDNTFTTGEAVQLAYLSLNNDGSDTTYQIVISRVDQGSQQAKHLRYIVENEGGDMIGKYLETGQPTLFGHPAAANADGVAAYDYMNLTTPESFTNFGPVTIYFDESGDRLANPAIRQQPTIAAVDDVDTTFFPEGPLSETDTDNDGFPNFSGTSAAAPHAAGVAALLLQAAGGSGALSSAQMRALLQSTGRGPRPRSGVFKRHLYQCRRPVQCLLDRPGRRQQQFRI